MEISGVYKITNTITGDFYIGSSKNIKRRWADHKRPSRWNEQPNNPMYLDMKNFGVDKFVFELLEEVEVDKLKETEQKFIEILKPTYNSNRASGRDVERYKESQKEYSKEYEKSEKRKEYKKKYNKSEKHKKYQKEYEKSEKRKEYKKKYNKSEKHKKYQKEYEKSEKRKEYKKKYNNQLCSYNGEILTLCALASRFRSAGIPHPQIEAKKYLL